MRLLALLLVAAAALAAHADDDVEITTCKALIAQLGLDVTGSTVFCPTDKGFEKFAKEMGFGKKKDKKDKKEEKDKDKKKDEKKDKDKKDKKKKEKEHEQKEHEEQGSQLALAPAAGEAPAKELSLASALGKLGRLTGAAAPAAASDSAGPAPAAGPAAGKGAIFSEFLAALLGVAAPPSEPGAGGAPAPGGPVARMVAAVPAEDLKTVLQFHVVPGKVLPASSFTQKETVLKTLVPDAPITVVTKKGKLKKVLHEGPDVDDTDEPNTKVEDEDIEATDLTFEGKYEAGTSAYVVHAIEKVMVPLPALKELRAARAKALAGRRLMMLL